MRRFYGLLIISVWLTVLSGCVVSVIPLERTIPMKLGGVQLFSVYDIPQMPYLFSKHKWTVDGVYQGDLATQFFYLYPALTPGRHTISCGVYEVAVNLTTVQVGSYDWVVDVSSN